MFRPSGWSLPSRFSNQNTECISHPFHVYYMSYSSHPHWFDHPNNVWWSIQVMKSSLCSPLQPLATSSLIGPNILLSWAIRFQFLMESGIFFFVTTFRCSGVQLASYPMGTGCSFPGGNMARVWSWPLTSI
jgi:hypothetical protein